MKTISCSNSLMAAAIAAALSCGAPARAATVAPPVTPMTNPFSPSLGAFQLVSFQDGAEADMLRNAYRILATGDHDYKGRRVKAMKAVEAAGKLLGIDLAGDLKDHTPQPLSDEKLREAQGLITQVLDSAEVKHQKRVVKHLNAAVAHINAALSIR